MSELTECNYCTLKRMEAKAALRGATVETVLVLLVGTSWITVKYSDHDKPSAHFLQLTSHCVC